MSKKEAATSRTEMAASDRSPERRALADAICVRDEAEERAASLRQMRSRVDEDLPRALGAVDRAEKALKQARDQERDMLLDAYASAASDSLQPDRSATAEPEAECESAWNKDPVFGVIGIRSGPRE